MNLHFDLILPLPLSQELLSLSSGHVLPTLTVSPLSFNDPLFNWGCWLVYRKQVILLNHGQVTSGYILKKNDSTP